MVSLRTLARWGRRRLKRASARALLVDLKIKNRWSARSVVGDTDVIVSLTTYGKRMTTVAYAIESIARGRSRPRQLVLWLDDERAFAELPADLRRLQRRGLRIELTENYGPHTKYFPALDLAVDRDLRLVTADDDILYPRSWLRRLVAAAHSHPGAVNGYRVSVVGLEDSERIKPYDSWAWCRTTSASVAHFATGVSGVIYPTVMIRHLQEAGTGFLNVCPKADDIWLHWNALRHGVPVRQVADRSRHFLIIPGTQDQTLMAKNVLQGANDVVISRLYDAADRAAIRHAYGQ